MGGAQELLGIGSGFLLEARSKGIGALERAAAEADACRRHPGRARAIPPSMSAQPFHLLLLHADGPAVPRSMPGGSLAGKDSSDASST